jgi:hypothetical protein
MEVCERAEAFRSHVSLVSDILSGPVLCVEKKATLFGPAVPSSSRAQQSLVGLGLLVIEASRSHSDSPHSVGLLWTSDQSDAETST